MFEIDRSGNMRISRGDSAELFTRPEQLLEDGSTEPIVLGEDECIIFTVKSQYSGETLIKRILTADDYSDDLLCFVIKSSETDVQPDGYNYSFMYVPDITYPDEAYTYSQGAFEILPSVSNTSDLD